jgi:putative ABC transport system permease protein
VGLAALGSDLLISYASRFTVRTGEIGIDVTVLAVTGLVATAAALALAWIPPLPGLRGVVTAAAGAGQRVVGINRKGLQRALVVGQLALCFTLIVGALLMVRSLINLNAVDPGLEYQSVIAMDVPNVTGIPGDRNRQLMEELAERTRGFPGVRAVAYASHVPFTEGTPVRLNFRIEGSDADEIASPGIVQNTVSDDYFETVGIRLIAGRPFQATDIAGNEDVAIINASLARYLFGDDSPIDRRVQQQQFNGQYGPWVRIVGVAADTREYGIAEGTTHTAYRPSAQTFPGQSIVIRTAGDITGVIQQTRATVRELDAARPVDNIATLENLRFEDMAPPRLNATLFSAFAALALVIATVGILGVLGFSVTQRTREFGLRMALGARKDQVLRMVLGEGGRMLAIALVLGAIASLLLTRFLTTILFEIDAADPLTYALVAFLLTAVALLAAYLPARRATRVDPAVALRVE